jgi:hypothetical protein
VNTEQAIKALKKLHRLCPANDDGDEMSEALVDAIVTLRAQQVRGKRCEAAEGDIEKLLEDNYETTCDFCGNVLCYRKGGSVEFCDPKWRGPQEGEK